MSIAVTTTDPTNTASVPPAVVRSRAATPQIYKAVF